MVDLNDLNDMLVGMTDMTGMAEQQAEAPANK